MADKKVGLDTLQAWQKAREFVIFVHQQIIPVLPDDEKWDLTQQIRRSSKSVMANIRTLLLSRSHPLLLYSSGLIGGDLQPSRLRTRPGLP